MATISPPEKLAPRHIVKGNDLSTWDLAWCVLIHSSVHPHYNDLPSRRQNVTPWDKGDVQPSLKEAVESSGIEFPREGRAFVPGCGSVGFPPRLSSFNVTFDSVRVTMCSTLRLCLGTTRSDSMGRKQRLTLRTSKLLGT